MSGTIYVDDIGFATEDVSGDSGTTDTSGEVVPVAGQIGRIIFTVKVEEKRYSLYSTDPTWSKAVKIGEEWYVQDEREMEQKLFDLARMSGAIQGIVQDYVYDGGRLPGRHR